MREVIIVCEGQTEREFCKSVLAPYLVTHGIQLAGKLAGKPNRRQGGIRNWQAYRMDLLRTARERDDRHVGLLVDYYAMPNSWPGRENAPNIPIDERGKHVEDALRADLHSELGCRFLPCVQLHEFESLLFVDPETTASKLTLPSGVMDESQIGETVQLLTAIKTSFHDFVQRINDSHEHKPSKRIEDIFPAYDKVGNGILVVQDVRVETLRAGCPWLDRWMTKLETLGESLGGTHA